MLFVKSPVFLANALHLLPKVFFFPFSFLSVGLFNVHIFEQDMRRTIAEHLTGFGEGWIILVVHCRERTKAY